MKVLIIHNDLRVYWKRRLIFLREFLKDKQIDLHAVELFGKGSPYDFDLFSKSENWWDCLFPDKSVEELDKYQIRDKIFSKLNEVKPDVVIAGSIVFYAGALALRWSKLNGKKFIMFDDAKATDVKRNWLVQTIKNTITRQIDALWIPSTEYRDGYAAILDTRKIDFFYGYDCIDNDLFKFRGDSRSFNSNVIVCVGRLVPIKNFDSLLRAWKEIEAVGHQYQLKIIGDGPILKQLKELQGTLELHNVSFLGAMPNEKVLEQLHMADAFILPSHAESWGLVVNEAMAAGLPVLLSNKVNAAGTLLKEGENGFGFSPDDVGDIQSKIARFIKLTNSEKQIMSNRSLQIISEMDFTNMGEQLLGTLNKLASKQNNRASFLPRLLINLWYGRYNTKGWDKAEDLNDKRLFR